MTADARSRVPRANPGCGIGPARLESPHAGEYMTPETILWVGWTLFGAIVGSFLNAFVHRWPRRISLLTRTRSFCPRCEKDIAWYDNIPVLSYLVLLGRCRNCRERIPLRYLLVELTTTALFSFAYYKGVVAEPERLGWPFVVIASLVVADLVALSFVDIETYTVPLITTTALIVAGVALAPVLPWLKAGGATEWTGVQWLGERRLDAMLDSLQGIILGGGLIWATGAVAELIIRKEAMGAGDVKILAGVGALLGWKAAVATFFIAPCIGTAVGLPMILKARLFPPKKPKRDKGAGKGEKDRARTEGGITYRYEADEAPPPADEEVVKSRFLLVFGFVLAAEQTASIFILKGARASPLTAAPLYFGATIGFFMAFYDIIRRRLVREGRWIRREIETAEDGSTEERLTGHYLPFGPFLALAAVVVLLFGSEIMALAETYLFPIA